MSASEHTVGMVSVGALVLVALATPYAVVVTFAVLFTYGTDPPWPASAILALALAAPGPGGLLIFAQGDVLDVLAGSLLTATAAVALINPTLVTQYNEYEVIEGSRLHRYRDRVATDDGPLALLLARLLTIGFGIVGLYITADALLATPETTTYPVLF
jgi:hypothetical protein